MSQLTFFWKGLEPFNHQLGNCLFIAMNLVVSRIFEEMFVPVANAVSLLRFISPDRTSTAEPWRTWTWAQEK